MSLSIGEKGDVLLVFFRFSIDLTASGAVTAPRKIRVEILLPKSWGKLMNHKKTSANIGAIMLCAFVGLSGSSQIFAQDEDTFTLDEIIVTGRKREESLVDVPVSISVVGSELLEEQNVLSMNDLAELVPGLDYSQGPNGLNDRIAALPSIRGVQSSEIATNRTKVTSFIDGMPIIGSVGAINIGGASQVEVYSGPQSAAFGRSTFGGAINYVTRDPGDELEGTVGINWSDTGTRIINGTVGGPLTESIGFQLGANFEDSTSEDPDIYTYSDGIEANTRGGTNLSARLVFNPSDNLNAKLTFTHDETDDGPGSSNFYATQASSAACFNSLNTFSYTGGMGAAVGVDGTFDCELDVNTDAGLITVHDITQYYDDNPADFDALVADARAAGATDGVLGDYTVEEAIALINEAYSVPVDDAGSQTERDRIMGQLDYLLDNGSAIQLSFMDSSDTTSRHFTNLASIVPVSVIYQDAQPACAGGPPCGPPAPATPAQYAYDAPGGMVASETATNDITEQYLEVRWASPGEERLRYLVGASMYEYDFLSQIYRNGGYNAVPTGLNDGLETLTGVFVSPNTTFSEFTENKAFFFSAAYDFTDKITGSLEGRYSMDKVGGRLPSNPEFGEQFIETNTFTPRLALNYSPNDDTTLYVQYAVGVNPGGINASMLDPELRELLDVGIPVDDTIYGGSIDTTESYVNFDTDDYTAFTEETLTNFEFGFKGSAFDNRLTYTGALYHMIWEDAVQPVNIDFDYTYADDDLAGTLVTDNDPAGPAGVYYVNETDNTGGRVFANQGDSTSTGLELQANYRLDDSWSLRATTSIMKAEYSDFCDSGLFTGNAGDLGEYAGLDVSVDPANGNDCYVLDGNKLINQPGLTVGLTPSYRTDIGGVSVNVATRLSYRGSTFSNTANVTETPSTFTANLNIGLTMDNWSGSFYIENLLDDRTVSTAAARTAAQYQADYVDSGVAPAADPTQYFNVGGSAVDYSNLRYRIPTGRSFGFRMNYRF